MRRATFVLATAVVAVLLSGCGGTVPAQSSAAASASAAPSGDPWTADLATFDAAVRASHPNPFANTPEAVWVAKLAELRKIMPALTPDQQIVQFASLVGLLDTHSGLSSGSFHAYGVLLYPFADGWYVDRARDPTLVGARVVSIGGHPIAEVEAALRPLVPADNESGKLDGLQSISLVEYLHGLGIVDDPDKPAFVFEMPDRTRRTVDLKYTAEQVWESDLGITGDLMGSAPEAVARRSEPVWTRLDKPTRTFVLSYNDYTDGDLEPALSAMKAAVDDGSANRVLIDMRYIRGGNGSLADPLIAAVRDDPRINRPGALIVMIGRENVSAGTVVARTFDTDTQAILVGEMTPARADGFLCDCADIYLPNSALSVEIPTYQIGVGDQRLGIQPDLPIALTGSDFFAGKDPALKAALAIKGPPAP